MGIATKSWLLVFSMLALTQTSEGARLLKQVSSSVSATVGGSPGTTGTIQVGVSGPQGSFSQTTPVSGPASLQFSSEDGGTLTLSGPDGQTQTFSSVLGPPGVTVPALPTVPVIGPAPTVVFSGVPPIPNLTSSVDFLSLDPSLAAKINARIQQWFASLRRAGPYIATSASSRPVGSAGVAVGSQSASVTVGARSAAPVSQGVSVQARSTSGGVVPAPSQIAPVSRGGAVVPQQAATRSAVVSNGNPQSVQVSATAAGPSSVTLGSSSVTTG